MRSTTTPRSELGPRGMPAFALLLRLAFADLWHERILTLCVVVALTAVLSPLLILMSLKYGLVETLRSRLINDPRNREIRPQSSQIFTQADIEALRQRTDVSYVMPQTRAISTMVRVSLPGSEDDQIDTEIQPTGAGDPLLEENGTNAPGIGQCALSQSLHHRLAANGDFGQIRVTVKRQGASGLENETTMLTVAGVVGERATSRETIFVPLEFVEQIESWLEGHPVAALGWKGNSGGVSPVMEEIIVPTTRPLTPSEQAALVVSTGFSGYEEVSREEVDRLFKPPAEAQAFYRFTTSVARHEDPADSGTLTRFRNSLPPVAGDIYGYCRPIQLELMLADGRPVRAAEFMILPEVVNKPAKKPEATPAKAPKVAPMPPVAGANAQASPMPAPVVAVPVPDVPNTAAGAPAPGETVLRPTPMPGLSTAVKPPPPQAPLPIMPMSPPRGAPGIIVLDEDVKPLNAVPVPNPRSPEARGDARPPLPKSTPPPPKGKKRSSGFGAGIYLPGGGRYIVATAPQSLVDAPAPPAIYLPQSWGVADGQTLTAVYQTPSGPVSFPAVVHLRKGEEPLLPQSTAGMLRVGMDRPIEFREDVGTFVTTRRGWPNFRLVAKDIDSVQGLVDHFHNLGMNVITKAERIRDVKELDTYTSQVFWLIAGVGLTGAAGALLANLFAAVERKRRSLGVLRLLGLRRRSLVRLPFYQSTLIVSASVGLSIAAWWWVSSFIGRFTAHYLEAGERLATLPREHLLILWGGALVIAAIASLLAGLRVMRVDPSEAIRDE